MPELTMFWRCMRAVGHCLGHLCRPRHGLLLAMLLGLAACGGGDEPRLPPESASHTSTKAACAADCGTSAAPRQEALAAASSAAGKGPPPVAIAGKNQPVGAARLFVQLQQGRVDVRPDHGSAASLVAEIVQWDADARVVTLAVALRNDGIKSLFMPGRAVVTRLASPATTVLNADEGSGIGSWTWRFSGPPVEAGSRSAAQVWRLQSPHAMDFQLDVTLHAGVPLAAGEAATIVAADGTSVSVPAAALPYEALVDIRRVPQTGLPATSPNLPVVDAVELTIEPHTGAAEPGALGAPLSIAVPSPAGVTATRFIVAQQVDLDASGGTPGLRAQFMPVDTAVVSGGVIRSDAAQFDGVRGPGIYALLANTGSGFVRGTVREGGTPRVGVVVSNSTNTLVAMTNGAGVYQLFVNGGAFTVTAFDPFRGTQGTASGNIAVPQSTVTADIAVAAAATAPVTRDGLRNAAFERGDLSSWTITGSARVIERLGPTSTGVAILPTEGRWMADLSTGTGSVGGVGSSLRQRFVVPAGVTTLKVDFNFISEEFPEFVGSVFDDAFRAIVTTPDGQRTMAAVSVNSSGGFQLIGDCGFPGGDSTCGQTGWRIGSVDLSAYAGTNTPIEVELLFSATDAGDNIYDTHVLVDNIRFKTVWVDVKMMVGSAATEAAVRAHVREANEVLSQAGINVEVRSISTLNDPGNLLDTDITFTFGPATTLYQLTAEEIQLLGSSRSATSSDLNVYYVRSVTGAGAVAVAIGPDEFSGVGFAGNAGVIMTDASFPETLAHEIGHLVLSPDRAGSALEHNNPSATNIMHAPRSVPRNVLSRAQSVNVLAASVVLLR